MGSIVWGSLDKRDIDKIRCFLKNQDLTPYVTLLSVFTILLSKLSGEKDTVFDAFVTNEVGSVHKVGCLD